MNAALSSIAHKASRFLVLGFALFSSLVCVLTFTPFTYTHVIEAGMFPWLRTFTTLHPWLNIVVTVLACAELLWSTRTTKVRSVRALLLLLGVSACVLALVRPLAGLGPLAPRSFYWSQALLLPPLVLAVADRVLARTVWETSATREESAVFRASVASLLLGFGVYTAVFLLRGQVPLGLENKERAIALCLSILLHGAFVGALFAVWILVRGLAARGGARSALWEHTALTVLFAALFAGLARGLAFEAIALKGKEGIIAAAAWGLCVTFSIGAISLRHAHKTGSGIRLLFAPLALDHERIQVRALWALAVLAFAVGLQTVAARMDVGGLMQKLSACFSWVLIFAACLNLFRERAHDSSGRTLVLVAFATLSMLLYRGWRSFGHPADHMPLLERVATSEPSFGLLYGISASTKTGSIAELYEVMQKNTSLPQERAIAPLDVQFVNDFARPNPRVPLPNIFIIVIDSLRRDYLSPFNPAVTFTPELDAFAKASDVFENAFTHYGATGLSEPSIWLGGMMPHKQYITPFAPMNSLEKLVKGNAYQRYVSVDSILAQLIDQKSAPFAPLDANVATGDLELCTTLHELEGKLAGSAPIFAYTQAQNIHVSTITRDGANALDGQHYSGFYDPYASRIARFDACFGAFIRALTNAGLYDNSIVVFTADHGDLLGEEGRWGHAYNLNPEVVRIPLIIHRPPNLRSAAVDTKRVAFSTDISPSLYRMLGYAPATLGAWFGQSLYGPREKDRDWHMLVSSYGPVYGIIEEQGKYLYVADAVGYSDTYYDVAKGSNALRDTVSEEVRTRNAERIRQGIKELHESFHVRE
jgi:hypothetical protein